MSLSQFKREIRQLKEQAAQKQKITVPSDALEFFRETLQFTPTAYQKELICQFQSSQFIAARWARQTGKSHTISALLLHYALTHPGSCVGVFGPSWRQTKLIIKHVNAFLQKLPKSVRKRPQKTSVHLANGSTIEAYPNNPETIRGPKLHIVYADEFNFIPNDEELYDAILFTLGTTDGKFVCTSTPWHTSSIFYKIFHHPSYGEYAKSHVTYEQALEPDGPLKPQILSRIKRQLEGDPARWKREMQADWAENEDAWLSQSLITSCIDHTLEYTGFQAAARGNFYMGLDLGKHQDYSVLAAVQTQGAQVKLVHMHQFPLKTPYAAVIGYVKTLSDRWQTAHKILVDSSGVGDYITEDMQNAGIPNVEGVNFTVQSKQQMAQHLKQAMTESRLSLPYDSGLISELNVEQHELSKDGKIKFNHPQGTHDDRFWALAMATYATRSKPAPKLWVLPKTANKAKTRLQQQRRRFKGKAAGEKR
ncbi:MAG: terminase family protein [Candidatus Bathyarchaeota archaeon]|nr:terminase family protein [Candidatus Bathyarchaeota archaeon]